MRLIDAEKLIEEATRQLNPSGLGETKLYSEIIQLIATAPTVNEWISVERELPKDNKKVVIKDADGDVYIARHINGNWDCLYFSYDYEDVIAWKPIEPYTGDKE